MDFPIDHLMDEQACYAWLVRLLHPHGLSCPRCGRSDHWGVHRRIRDPVLDYRCRLCGCVFNAFTGTSLHGRRRSPSHWVLILRGISQGQTTAGLARELHASRGHLLEFRHQLQDRAARALDRKPLPDAVLEVDEMYENAGEKRSSAPGCGRSAAPEGQPLSRTGHLGT